MPIKYFEKYYESTQPYKSDKVKYLVVIVYDIPDNKRRNRLAKYLLGYGIRVQKSVFECILDNKKYDKLCKEIPKFLRENDLLKIYKIYGRTNYKSWGNHPEHNDPEVIIM